MITDGTYSKLMHHVKHMSPFCMHFMTKSIVFVYDNIFLFTTPSSSVHDILGRISSNILNVQLQLT